MQMLQTRRLFLRPFTEADVDDVYDYAKHPEVGPRCGWPVHQSRKDSLTIITEFFMPENNERSYAMEERASGKVIGSASIKSMADLCLDIPIPRFELGYALHPDYWGKGLAVEASRCLIDDFFEKKYAETLYIAHLDFNIQSKRVIEKLGFLPAGQWEEYAPLLGKTHTYYIYKLTEQNWFKELT